MNQHLFFFGGDRTEGDATMKNRLGGKGANLAEMSRIGLPVPPGFTIESSLCDAYHKAGGRWPEGLADEMEANIRKLEQETGKTLGDPGNPLLLSVRSGAAVSMPGMMDTVLNIGMNDAVLEGLAATVGNRAFPLDAYRRLVLMHGDVVRGLSRERFEKVLEGAKKIQGVRFDSELSASSLTEVLGQYKAIYAEETGEAFPEDPMEQLRGAVTAVFQSWHNPRADTYRRLHGIRGLLGTAVNVQAMVFGNRNDNSGSGVGFTRDPSTGENTFFAEYVFNAQGEDVVAGIRTPVSIGELHNSNPGIYEKLMAIRAKLEEHYRDMQDIEFTVDDGELFILQTRGGKRTIFAHLRIAVDLVEAKVIAPKEAVLRVPPAEMGKLFAPELDPSALVEAVDRLMGSGLNASPGGACGRVVFSAEEAQRQVKADPTAKVMLCRTDTSPEDIGGMAVAQGILTSRGGMTSHAAVVARGMGVPCVSGAQDVIIDYAQGVLRAGSVEIRQGDFISINGFDGKIYSGEIPVIPSEIVRVLDGDLAAEKSRVYRDYVTFMGWVDEFRRLRVRTNADKPSDVRRAVQFGAEGIGLCRTEHMFFDNINPFRRLILVAEEVKVLRDEIASLPAGSAGDRAECEKRLAQPLAEYDRALDELLPIQRRDFEGIFEALAGLPANIRLLDPPLHEFLPKEPAGQEEMARELGVDAAHVREQVEALSEANPMLGHRGCRLGLIYPEVSDMQVRAILEAAVAVKKRGVEVQPEIMIPLVGHARELALARERAVRVADAVIAESGLDPSQVPYKVGTMIEVPRAAITADEVAEHADFFSFGTNDLTQMACGFSRDDAGKFLSDYVRMGIYQDDPFKVIDTAGVGKLMTMAIELGRQAKPGLKIGICGEHGGEPKSVAFCHRAALDYVSCSPYRVPVARLAAAVAALEVT
jgi:pyruvate,orthophosphate dikinase